MLKLRRQVRDRCPILKRGEIPDSPWKMHKGEKAVFMTLALAAHDDGTSIYCGVEHICLETGLSRWWVQKCLRALERKGFVVPLNLLGGRKKFTSYYIPLNEFGYITPTPPEVPAPKAETRRKELRPAAAAVEVTDEVGRRTGPLDPIEDLEKRLHFARGMYERLKLNNESRKHWGEEIAELERLIAARASPLLPVPSGSFVT